MSDIVIRAEGLGKKYLIGHQANERYTALRDVVAQTAKSYIRSARDMIGGRQLVRGDEVEEFWALKDVNFEIRRGDIVGVIGRNGAGKSTLLKILSRITEPSAGRVEIRGRVASLLEVGTGFHPELTGRENIFLNGAILGMSRAEIKRKFDEIVAFAEVEKFLDTPVKRYSSGMYVRLAFAVAAHLEPDILVVDEVLAVGDAEFQKKCLGKMGEVAERGRTLLFVSHNMAAINHLCSRGILLSNGKVLLDGAASEVSDRYLAKFFESSNRWSGASERKAQYITGIEVLAPKIDEPAELRSWESARFRIHYHSDEAIKDGSVTFQISTTDGRVLVLSSTRPDHNIPMGLKKGDSYVDIVFERLYLTGGEYVLGAGLAIPYVQWLYNEPQGMRVTVKPVDVYCSGYVSSNARYLLLMPHTWRVT